jgi:NAD(P)H-hydrate epimerase
MVTPLEDGGSGRLIPQQDTALTDAYDWADAIALGPGLGLAGETAEFMAEALQQPDAEKPLVLDADGLNLLADAPERLKDWRGPAVLTPHPGEAARLLDCSIADVVVDRIASARELAGRFEAIAVLKGAPTVIAAADGQAAICPLGNPGMASGGTGDVLTGVIAGLLAQGLSTYVAAALGVYLHALSGDLAALDLGVWSLMAGDLVRYLPAAFRHIETCPDLDVLAEGIRT